MSRDVVFDETKSWKWSGQGREIGDDPRMFEVNFGDFGIKGIGEHNNTETEETEKSDKSDEVQSEEEDDSPQNETEEGEEQVQSQPELRAPSTRPKKKPSYLEDYVLLAEIERERLLLQINEEP